MNLLEADLMQRPSLHPGFCIVCYTLGRSQRFSVVTRHHVVPRSHGGTEGPQHDL